MIVQLDLEQIDRKYLKLAVFFLYVIKNLCAVSVDYVIGFLLTEFT